MAIHSFLLYFGSLILGINISSSIINNLCFFPTHMQDKTIQVLNSCSSHDPENQGERGSCSHDAVEDQSRLMHFMEEDASTRLQHLAMAGLATKPVYRLHSAILLHTPITENMRAKLRTFLMSETSKQCLLRETCTLACTLVDLYFLHQGQVVVSEFQNLVLGCLILASKLREGKFPTISYNIFSREQLLAYERKVARKLNYFLEPHTYHSHAERIVFLWDQHTRKEGKYNLKLGECVQGVNFKLRKFYEQLDCIYMVLRSLDYNCEELVLNLFYLNARIINVYDVPNPHLLSQHQFLEAFYPQHDGFMNFYLGFLKFYSKREYKLDPRMGNYLKLFLGVSTAHKQWTIKGNAKVLEQMRIWDKIQTYPKDNYVLAKRVIEKVRQGGEFNRN